LKKEIVQCSQLVIHTYWRIGFRTALRTYSDLIHISHDHDFDLRMSECIYPLRTPSLLRHGAGPLFLQEHAVRPSPLQGSDKSHYLAGNLVLPSLLIRNLSRPVRVRRVRACHILGGDRVGCYNSALQTTGDLTPVQGLGISCPAHPFCPDQPRRFFKHDMGSTLSISHRAHYPHCRYPCLPLLAV